MASIFTHFSILILYFLFPEKFDFLALLVGCQFPDIEYYFIYVIRLIKNKSLSLAYKKTKEGILHTFLGSVFFSLPVATLIFYLFFSIKGVYFNFNLIFFSLAVGMASHLLLDIPAHNRLILFYPFVFKENPFLIRIKLKIIEKIYPYKKIDEVPYQYIYEYHWLVLSHIFLIFSFIIYFMIN